MSSSEPRVDPLTRACYGIGSIAYGIKDNGFGYFLLFYYSQVLGLPSAQASLAIFVALLLDAASDPIVGIMSDRLHSRWGRRHPLMYASAIPIAASFYFLWNPPELSPDQLFLYLIVLAALVRTCLTFFEVPSTALAPELTDLYDERTILASIRYFFGWAGGIMIAAIAYGFLFVDTPELDGRLIPGGYELYGLIGASIMFIAILISAVGTHHRIPTLGQPPAKRKMSFMELIRETRESLSNRSFMAIFIFGIFSATGSGFAGALSIYLYTYLWQLSSKATAPLILSGILSAAIATYAAPALSRRLGKKRAAIIFAFLAGILVPLPVALRLVGLMPENGSTALLPTLIAFNVLAIAQVIAASTLVSSMMADIVDESELETGRRSEGIFFAARSFISKSLSGLGIVFATILLEIVSFPPSADPANLDTDIVWRLGAGYVPTVVGFFVFAMIGINGYRLTREQHEANLVLLAEREAS